VGEEGQAGVIDAVVQSILLRQPGWSARRRAKGKYGNVTYRLDQPGQHWRFLKVSPRSGRHTSLAAECARTRWAGVFLPVPEVIDCGATGDFEWLITRGIDAADATDPLLRADAATVVEILAKGLRQFHEAPVGACPFDFGLDAALDLVERRIAQGLIDVPADLHPEHAHLSIGDAWNILRSTRPSSEDLVVCHGDYCFPNTLISGGAAVAFVDLGELGVADRWWDLAVATWSTTWNVGPGWEDAFLAVYGIEPDRQRMAYYRLLYDLVS
jgi:kanamycin kinase